MGKSTVLTELFTQTKLDDGPLSPLAFNLRSYSSEDRLMRDLFDSAALNDWRLSDRVLPLFLDSYDECRVPTLASLLLEQLERLPRERLQLRIACRSGDWPILLRREFPRLWPKEKYCWLR